MYGPNPYIARRKWPSGHLITSGVVIPALSGSKMRARQAWYICLQNTWYFAVFLYFFVAICTSQISSNHGSKANKYILFGIGRNATGSKAFPCALRAILVKLPGDIYTGWYSWCPVATETVVLSLPTTTGTNMAPCVDSSLAISSFTVLCVSRITYYINSVTYCLFPCPVRWHKICNSTGRIDVSFHSNAVQAGSNSHSNCCKYLDIVFTAK